MIRPVAIGILAALLCGLLPPPPARGGPALEVVGVDVVPHRFSDELRWRGPPDPRPGALVRLFVRNAGDAPAQAPSLRTAGAAPEALLDGGSWTWHDVPGTEGEEPRPLGPGRLDVWTFNAVGADWAPGATVALALAAAPGATPVQADLRLEPDPVRLARVLFHDGDGDGLVDACTVHVVNDSPEPVTFRGLRVWSPGADGAAIHDLAPGEWIAAKEPLPADGIVPAGERGMFAAECGPLPPARGVIEVGFAGGEGAVLPACFAHLRFKDDAFAIGSGWLDVPSRPGVVPLLRERCLALYKRMHIDTAHVGEYPGYTDATGPDGLATRYPLRLMSGFEDIARYGAPEWRRRIHGVDILGEPQMGKTPRQSRAILARYDRAPYPTTVTLSEEKGFRFYAGLSDHPHFDAYRVNAPAADAWSLYDRWGGERLRWGAPLEGIGAMTRTLRELSRPAPIAAWSQNVHENWDGYAGRRRRSPTPDEIRIQAYEALASGINALYWYSLQAWSPAAFRDTIPETTRIGREIRLLQGLYDRADAWSHERRDAAGRPDWDLDALVAPDGAVLFAIDLAYEPDPEARVFRFRGPRALEAEYALPAILRAPQEVFRVDADGVHDVAHEITPRGVTIRDTVDRVGIYVAARRAGLRTALAERQRELVAAEAAWGPDPGTDDEAFAALLADLGFERVEDLPPAARP